MTDINSDNNFGDELRRSREEKGFTLDMIHEATNIPLDILRAIEEGYKVGTLSPFYFRGFVKIYAQFLDLDPDLVLKGVQYETKRDPLNYLILNNPNRLAPSDVRTVKKAPSVKADVKKAATKGTEKAKAISQTSKKAAGVASVKAQQSFENFQRWLTPDRRQRIIKVFGVVFLLFVSVKILGFVGSKLFKGKPKSSGGVVEVKAPQTTHERELKEARSPKQNEPEVPAERVPSPASVPVASTVPVASKAVTKPVALTVKAKRNTWIQVRTDGAIVFQSILKKGVAETWYANERIELSGKDVDNLEFEVNGKHIGSLGRADRKAKKLVITPKGMSVEK